MSFDVWAKKSGAFLPAGLVAVAAYFQAAGIGQLVGAHLVPNGVSAVAHASTVDGPIEVPGKDAAPILARNPFDSTTGPLDGKTVAVSDLKPPPAPTASGDPYLDAPCAGVTSSMVTAAEDPAWSFASFNSSEGKSLLRRRGDKIGSATVVHIGFMGSEAPDYVPRVWLSENGTRCLVDTGTREGTSAKRTTPEDARPSKPKSKLAQDIESKITKVGENSYVVERGAVEQIIQNYAKLAGSLRSRATKDGVRVSGIKKDSILGKVGMQNGDLLQAINGFDMTDPEKAVDAYAKLRTAGKLDITMSRDGTPTNISIAIK